MEAILVFLLNQQKYGLSLSAVERVVPVVEFTAMPKAPVNILGVINLQGLMVPVYNTRLGLGLLQKEIALSDQLIIVQVEKRMIALLVDTVIGLLENPEQVITPEQIALDLHSSDQLVKQGDDLVILLNELEHVLKLNKPTSRVVEND